MSKKYIVSLSYCLLLLLLALPTGNTSALVPQPQEDPFVFLSCGQTVLEGLFYCSGRVAYNTGTPPYTGYWDTPNNGSFSDTPVSSNPRLFTTFIYCLSNQDTIYFEVIDSNGNLSNIASWHCPY